MMMTATRGMGGEKACVVVGSNNNIISNNIMSNRKKNGVGLGVCSSYCYNVKKNSNSTRGRMLLGIPSFAAAVSLKGGGGGGGEERMDGDEKKNTCSRGRGRPVAAEVSRTILELSSVATLSVLTTHPHPQQQKQDDPLVPLGFGVRFAVDHQGTPFFSLNPHQQQLLPSSSSSLSTLHVQVLISSFLFFSLLFSSFIFIHLSFFLSLLQLEQCGLRTPQCTILGTLARPQDPDDTKVFTCLPHPPPHLYSSYSLLFLSPVQKLQSIWQNRFQQQLHQDLLYILSVQRVLQIEDFMEVSLSPNLPTFPFPLLSFLIS